MVPCRYEEFVHQMSESAGIDRDSIPGLVQIVHDPQAKPQEWKKLLLHDSRVQAAASAKAGAVTQTSPKALTGLVWGAGQSPKAARSLLLQSSHSSFRRSVDKEKWRSLPSVVSWAPPTLRSMQRTRRRAGGCPALRISRRDVGARKVWCLLRRQRASGIPHRSGWRPAAELSCCAFPSNSASPLPSLEAA